MPLNIRSPFYGNPAGQVVPQAEQAALVLFDRLDLMTANVARSARRFAPTGAHNDAGFVLSVFMVQTIGRKRAAECPESWTSCRRSFRYSNEGSYGWKSARTGEVFYVSHTRNRTLNRLQPEAMNAASFTMWNVSRKSALSGAPAAPLEAAECGKGKEGMGYDTYPSGEGVARRKPGCSGQRNGRDPGTRARRRAGRTTENDYESETELRGTGKED